jgi:excisionase family DNA binding protein
MSSPVPILHVTVREAAAALRFSERTVWTLVASGELESFKTCGRRLVPVDALAAFSAAQRATEKERRRRLQVGTPDLRLDREHTENSDGYAENLAETEGFFRRDRDLISRAQRVLVSSHTPTDPPVHHAL